MNSPVPESVHGAATRGVATQGDVQLPERVDVLIVGTGPVGLMLANTLGRAQVQTLVVERNADLSNLPRAVTVDDEGMRALQAAGLAEAVSPHMLMGYDHRFYDRNGRLLIEVNPRQREFGFPKRNRFHQPIFEQILLRRAQSHPSVTTRFRTTLTDLRVEHDGVAATLEQGGSTHTVRARYLLGCDGGSSAVRRLAGIQMQGASHKYPWIVIDTENNPDYARYTRGRADPRRPSVDVPGPSGRRRYEFMLLPGEREADMLTDDKLCKLLSLHCDPGRIRIVRRAVYIFHSLLADRFSVRNRVFLAGDAAHMMPPFQGQGMNSGMRDAFNLGWKIAAVLKGTLAEKLLETYDQERRPHAAAMIQLAEKSGGRLMTRNPFRAFFRDLYFRLLMLLPPVRAYVSQMRFKPRPEAANGFFIHSEAPFAQKLVGRMLPQPDVLTAEGVRVPLDTLLGEGFALLAIRNEPDRPFSEFTQSVWSRLGARRICAMPGGLERLVEGVDAVIGDISGDLAAALGEPGDVTLLVRPDRYIAAAMRAGDAAATATRLEENLR